MNEHDTSDRATDRTAGGAILMDGNRLRDEIVAQLRAEIDAAGSPPVCLATVLVGDDRPSQIYVRNKHKKAAEAGMMSRHVELAGNGVAGRRSRTPSARWPPTPACTASSASCRCRAASIPSRCCALIPPEKDVDGLTERVDGPAACAASRATSAALRSGVMRLLERYGVATAGQRAVVVGRSTLVGLPMVLLLGRKGVDATVTLAHSRTTDLVDVCREADIIVAAAGSARMITAAHVKPGAAVIDVGVSRTEAGIVGDVDFDAVQADRRGDHADARRHRSDDDRLPAREHARRGTHARRDIGPDPTR